MIEQIYKYPRTRHIEGSRLQAGDEDLKSVGFDELKGRYLVLEEKIDGANSGISFGQDKKLYLQSRGHFLSGGYGERQFDQFKQWAVCFQSQLYELLGSRYVMYGEWMYAKHTVFYDKLPHFFMEFDIFDKETGRFFSTEKRQDMLRGFPFVHSVLVLETGFYESSGQIAGLVGPSHFKTERAWEALETQCAKYGLSWEMAGRQTDSSNLMEGIYIKAEEGDYVEDRYKYVRRSFLNTILDSESHWNSRPVIPNLLAEGADLFGSRRDG